MPLDVDQLLKACRKQVTPGSTVILPPVGSVASQGAALWLDEPTFHLHSHGVRYQRWPRASPDLTPIAEAVSRRRSDYSAAVRLPTRVSSHTAAEAVD
jgi:hypothetical protein